MNHGGDEEQDDEYDGGGHGGVITVVSETLPIGLIGHGAVGHGWRVNVRNCSI